MGTLTIPVEFRSGACCTPGPRTPRLLWWVGSGRTGMWSTETAGWRARSAFRGACARKVCWNRPGSASATPPLLSSPPSTQQATSGAAAALAPYPTYSPQGILIKGPHHRPNGVGVWLPNRQVISQHGPSIQTRNRLQIKEARDHAKAPLQLGIASVCHAPALHTNKAANLKDRICSTTSAPVGQDLQHHIRRRAWVPGLNGQVAGQGAQMAGLGGAGARVPQHGLHAACAPCTCSVLRHACTVLGFACVLSRAACNVTCACLCMHTRTRALVRKRHICSAAGQPAPACAEFN